MVDLLLLAGVIGAIALGIGYAKFQSAAKRIADANKSAEHAVGAAEEMQARLDKALGEYQVAIAESTCRNVSLQKILSVLGIPEADPGPTIQKWIDTADRAKRLEKDVAEANEATRRAESKANDAEEARARAQSGLQQLGERFKQQQAQLDAMANVLATEAEKLADANKSLADARARMNAAEAAKAAANTEVEKLRAAIARDGDVKKELLGLPGAVGRVVFVVDRSASMERGGRWEDAKATIEAWIKHLPVKSCALVLFDSGVQIVPAILDTGRSAPQNSLELPLNDAATQMAMLQELSMIEPRGATQTGEGLRRAMQFKELDAIILFTDGAPDPDARSGGNPADAVLQLAKQWDGGSNKRCIHTVGVGDYFNPTMRNFLLGISEATGGAFHGR